jgi:FkbM family methyltransferase
MRSHRLAVTAGLGRPLLAAEPDAPRPMTALSPSCSLLGGNRSRSDALASTRRAQAELSYPAPRYFPFPPFRVVLETTRGSCNLAGGPPSCALFSSGSLMMPEPFVVQTIASFLSHCMYSAPTGGGGADGGGAADGGGGASDGGGGGGAPPCYAVDVGGNLGVHTAYMAALGAAVDVIEPARDLSRSIEATARVNCWEGRVRVFPNAISGDAREEGKTMMFNGGWRLDDRGARNRRRHTTSIVSLQRFLRGRRRVDLLKIDIDSARVEASLMVALEAMVAAGEADVRAVVFEAQSAQGAATSALAAALSRLQRRHGYYAYRLAHHLHSVADPEGWYSPCIGVRALKFALYIRPLGPEEWNSLLALRRDRSRGRADGASFVLSKEALGRGAEARWASESMDETLPKSWKAARCGE